MKKLFALFLAVFAVCLVFADEAKPKYVFLFIGDGMSTPQRMIADEFSRALGRGQLVINTLPVHATTRTCSANSLVTDSAAAATAIACGERTNNGRIGVNADASKRLVSLAEVARDNGKKIGIVTSVTINHATPAGFYGHRKRRSEYYAIGLDLIASKFDYFGGGGVAKHNDKTAPEYKGDIYDLAAKAGYKVVGTKEELLALKPGCGKVLAYGDKDTILPFAIDRKKDNDPIPTLAEFTAKGIELLQDGPNGFFMMVEGGAIDYAGHANDASTNLHEVIAFDMAVEVAVAFARKHPGETLIVVTGDHETGGMTMGFAGTGYALYVDRLINQTCSAQKFMVKIGEMKKKNPELSFDQVRGLLTESFGFKFSGNIKKDPMVLTAKETAALKAAFDAIPAFQSGKAAEENFKKKVLAFGLEAKRVISGKAGVGWTSGAHTGLPVLTTSMGAKADLFHGFINNFDISAKMKSIF